MPGGVSTYIAVPLKASYPCMALDDSMWILDMLQKVLQ
jgi:hypothetical protein